MKKERLKIDMDKLNVIDLFAGAGGLSLGFQKTEMFNIVAAVEKDIHAKKTYEYNFKGVDFYSDIRNVNFNNDGVPSCSITNTYNNCNNNRCSSHSIKCNW